MKNSYSVIENDSKITDKLLDNCSIDEIDNLYKLLDDLTIRTVTWYCKSARNRKVIDLVMSNKLEMFFRYEFSPIYDEEL